MRALWLLTVVLGSLAAYAPAADALKIPQICKPVKDKIITVPENPQFLLESGRAQGLEAISEGRELGKRITHFDAQYTKVVIEAAHGTTFQIDLFQCELEKITYRVDANRAPPPAPIRVLDIDFESADVELAPSAEGWFLVEIAGSEQDMQDGRVFRYVDYVDGTRQLEWSYPNSLNKKKEITTSSRLSPVSDVFRGRTAPYFMRVTPHSYDGKHGAPFEAWVGPKSWAPTREELGPSKCPARSKKPKALVVPPEAALDDRDYRGDRHHYPYALDSQGNYLCVRSSGSKFYVDADDGTDYELGFYPRDYSGCPGQVAADATIPVQVRASRSLWSPLTIRAEAPRVGPYWTRFQLQFNIEVEDKFGATYRTRWSQDGKNFVWKRHVHNLVLDLKKDVHTAYVRITPEWSTGDGIPWTAWVRITDGPKPNGAKTPKYYISEWGLGVVPGKQRMERRRFDWPE